MECNIKYVGKWEEEEVYYCVTHHKKASIKGRKLNECICDDKETFDNGLVYSKDKVQNILFIYPNLLESVNSILKINNQETSILYLGKSMLEKRDFGGLLLSRLNHINLEVEHCIYCGNVHSDDGKFAYKPHNPHLCAYCGKLFQVNHPNIGNEITTIFDTPDIILEDKCIEIDKELKLEYDVFKGIVLVNGLSCDKIEINNEIYTLKDYLNQRLYNEF